MYDIREFIKATEEIVNLHKLNKNGQYSRWTMQNDDNTRDLGINIYGCANAVNILYSINQLDKYIDEFSDMISTLQNFQDKKTGLYHDTNLHQIHTTAFVSGALELLNSKSKYAVEGLNIYKTKTGLYGLLESVDWSNNPWLGSHKTAGIYGAMVLNNAGDLHWQDWYFDWFDSHTDNNLGIWAKDCITDSNAPFFHHLASSFHYIFNYEYAKRPIPYPEKIVKTCIDAYYKGNCPQFGQAFGYNEIDFVYMITRCQRRCGKYFDEVQAIVKEIADKFFNNLLSTDWKNNKSLDDLHTLFAVISAVAVIQDALLGHVLTDKPLRLVIDRRPFL